jgi:hypothetical protein
MKWGHENIVKNLKMYTPRFGGWAGETTNVHRYLESLIFEGGE